MRSLLICIISLQFANSNDFIEAIYKFAYTDTTLAFTHKNVHFKCNVAGIKTVSNAISDQKINSHCLLELLTFQRKVPMQKYSAKTLLHNYITYHVESIGKTSCKVLLNASKSYAQKLLELGYARVDTKQKLDPFYLEELKRSEVFAKTKEVGIWKKKKWQTCLK